MKNFQKFFILPPLLVGFLIRSGDFLQKLENPRPAYNFQEKSYRGSKTPNFVHEMRYSK